ncbi:MAG: branched-chain amino acid ABC transporter permease, partial [Atribacterota bacterium]
PWLGEFVALKMLAVSIVAGLGNLQGGLVCGLLLGIIEAMAIGYFSGSWSNVIAFAVMLIVVLMKPGGLFGIKI